MFIPNFMKKCSVFFLYAILNVFENVCANSSFYNEFVFLDFWKNNWELPWIPNEGTFLIARPGEWFRSNSISQQQRQQHSAISCLTAFRSSRYHPISPRRGLWAVTTSIYPTGDRTATGRSSRNSFESPAITKLLLLPLIARSRSLERYPGDDIK